MQKIVQKLQHPAGWSRGRKFKMNAALKSLLECQEEIVTIADFFLKIHGEDSNFYENVFLKNLKADTPNSIDLKGKTNTGREVCLRYTCFRENNEVIWLTMDITKKEILNDQNAVLEIKKLKESLILENRKLKKSEKKYKSLYANTESPVVEIDQEFNVLSINDAFRKTFKYSNTFKLDTNIPITIWQILKTPSLEEGIKFNFTNSALRQKFQTIKVHTATNKELIVQMSIYAIKNQNKTYNYQVILHDLTEKLNKANEDFKHKNFELMEKMAQIVAHEVRNPLNNIILAQSQIKNHSSEKIIPFTDIIDRNTNRIEYLISRFLETFKKTELVLNKSCINKVVLKCYKNFIDKAKLTGTDLKLSILKGNIETLMDEDALELAINNLINNAIQACEEQEKRQVTISIKIVKSQLKIEIIDTGKGFNSDCAQRIFDPFFTNKKSGLGLGLTTSLRIVEAHNGKINYKTNKEKGATFSILLPLI